MVIERFAKVKGVTWSELLATQAGFGMCVGLGAQDFKV